MQATLSLQNWVEHLRTLVPVTGIVHVGATSRQAVAYADWGVSPAVLIEADESNYDKLAAVASRRPGWSAHAVLLSDREDEQDYYVANNPNESGIVAPERLTALWRNLKTKEKHRITANTLGGLLATLEPRSESINWVVIDCLPALPIIRGAGVRLDCWDVIIVRVVLDESKLPGIGATSAELDILLSEYGYRCVAIEEERHPAIGRALYIRDWKVVLSARLNDLTRNAESQIEANVQLQKANDDHARLASMRQAELKQVIALKDEQVRLALECQAHIEALSKVRDEQTKLATERQVELAQAIAANDELARSASECRTHIVQLISSRDDQARIAAERLAELEQAITATNEQARFAAECQLQVEQLTKAREDQASLIAELQAQLEQATAAKDEHARIANERLLQVEHLTSTRDEQSRLATERQRQLAETQHRFQQVELQSAELSARQILVQEEIFRAEAQIDLIKDVLLREPGL